jgi:1-acyl-sn-glycerol-3-phosphate acyltransferase
MKTSGIGVPSMDGSVDVPPTTGRLPPRRASRRKQPPPVAAPPPGRRRSWLEMLGEIIFQRLDPSDLNNRDPEFIAAVAPLINAAARWYFRLEHEGEEHLPAKGPVMAVGNHSGGPIMPDVWLILGWWAENGATDRPAYAMVHDIVFKIPVLKNFLMKVGALPANAQNAERALQAGATVLVYPGGELDCLRPFRDRNKVDFFDHTGFVRIAMSCGVPIVPIANAGGHEVYFVLFSSRALARWTGISWLTRVKTVPLTIGLPWGMWLSGFLPYLPLPAKLTYKVGAPIRVPHDPELARDCEAVRGVYDQVTTVLQRLVDDLARRRRFPVIG